jgi:hypothetical protein
MDMKILLVSNCQTVPLAHAIALHCHQVDIDIFQVHTAGAVDKIPALAAVPYDLVISAPLSDQFGLLAVDRIRTVFENVCIIPTIFFAGLHPDLVYVGGMGRRLPGPLGEYHSKIAVGAYALGLDPEKTASLFSDNVLGTLGYYDVFDDSLRELREREKLVDVPVSDIILDRIPDGLPMYASNHPSSLVIGPFVARLANHLEEHFGVEQTGWPAGVGIQDTLATSAIFPVYPPIAARHGCPAGSFAFKPVNIGSRACGPMTLMEFIEGEYSALDAGGVDDSWPRFAAIRAETTTILAGF